MLSQRSFFTTCMMEGCSEDLVDWRYLGVQAVPFLLAGLIGAAWLAEECRESQ